VPGKYVFLKCKISWYTASGFCSEKACHCEPSFNWRFYINEIICPRLLETWSL